MMKKTIPFLCLLFFTTLLVYPQQYGELYIPLEYQRAIKNGTRSIDGKPGVNYWQNYSDYKIKAEINPKSKELFGEEKIIYHNNSPDTLKQLVVRIYQDIYRKGNTRDFELPAKAITDGTEIKKIIINGLDILLEGAKESPHRQGTNLIFNLEKPVPPKTNIDLEFKWSYTISQLAPIRTGAYDSTSYLVAYWYPQMAVYDDISGWDMLNYTGNQEFYNDFSNYEVEITMPKGFLVWATGVLQNPEDVYSENILKKFKEAINSDKVVRIVTEEDLKNGLVTKDGPKNTWKYKAEGVTDFAFGTSDHYLWDGSSVLVDDNTKRKTFVDAAYKKESKDFYEVAEIARNSVYMLSHEFPGYPFPYPKITIFNGSGGMEYPMMVNDGSSNERWGTVHVTSHEISHTYFPFMMGINERAYAWMDEGWATALPFDIQEKLSPGYKPRERNAASYSEYGGTLGEVPLMVPSFLLTGSSYRTASYRRPGCAYDFLRDMLGDSLMKNALHEYMNRWKGKHPVPFDFFFTFNDVTKQNLNWYWKKWFFDWAYPDLAIGKVEKVKGKNSIEVVNIGGIPLPVYLQVTFSDGSTQNVKQTAIVWKNGNTKTTVVIDNNKKIKNIIQGKPEVPDVDKSNNVYEGK
ncbi:M1 family metallopeptidase [Melioribacteraceae bacterium 4301-Me]|uniref:M1 family metallopeptidase n=1 Tax=Pyranulibacter aquaticus TaxID=3163344 RepID=UPI003594E630